MKYTFVHAKLHNAVLTGVDTNGPSCVLIDQELMKACGILPLERVEVVSMHGHASIETYAMPIDEPGAIKLTGRLGRAFYPGDRIEIVAYVDLQPAEMPDFEATIVSLSGENEGLEIKTENFSHLL